MAAHSPKEYSTSGGRYLKSDNISPSMKVKNGCMVQIQIHNIEFQVPQIFEYFEHYILHSLSPSHGPPEEGTLVDIMGLHFSRPMICRSGHHANSPYFITSSHIQCTSPPHDIHVVWFSIGTQDSIMMSIEKTLEFHYYTQPTFFILSPSTSPVFGTIIVTVTGDSLLCGMGCSCTFGKTQVQAHQSGSEIACAMAGVEEGIVSMDIALNGKDFTLLSKSFEWRRPLQCLENVPSSGPSSGGYLVTIVGSDFPNTEFSCMFSEIEQ